MFSIIIHHFRISPKGPKCGFCSAVRRFSKTSQRMHLNWSPALLLWGLRSGTGSQFSVWLTRLATVYCFIPCSLMNQACCLLYLDSALQKEASHMADPGSREEADYLFYIFTSFSPSPHWPLQMPKHLPVLEKAMFMPRGIYITSFTSVLAHGKVLFGMHFSHNIYIEHK